MKRPYAEGHPFLSGETVTPGDFACTECGYHHRVPKPRITSLPVCPRCQNDAWATGNRK